MQKITPAEVGKILMIEFIFFPHTTITPELIQAWHLQFRFCEPKEFLAAIHLAVADVSKGFPPTPGEVWKILRRLRATPESLETSDMAWDSAWKNKNISKRTIAVLNLMPEWANRNLWNTEYLPFRKKEFAQIYNDLKEHDEVLSTQNIARTEIGYSREALPTIAQNLLKELGW